MEENMRYSLTDEEKEKLIDELTSELLLLRTKAEISQEEIANIIGTSRQTYGAIERKTRRMTWNTFMTLVMFYDFNKKTHKMIREMKAFPHEFIKRVNDGDEPHDFELGRLFKADTEKIIESLDEQALSTIRTVLMVEYMRCNDISGNAVVKFFEGIHFNKKEITQKQRSATRALKKIKKDL